MLSLPERFGTRWETIPGDCPYVRASETPVTPLGRTDDKPMIGLNWAGSESHANNRQRSIRLADFEPVLDVPHVRFFSLQFGTPADEIEASGFGPRVTDVGRDASFAQSAAIIRQLDLVITVDSAPGHLAGSLGKPVWVLLSHVPDWRWRMHGDATPWYPTMRLFRQGSRGDWRGVMAAVAEALPKSI